MVIKSHALVIKHDSQPPHTPKVRTGGPTRTCTCIPNNRRRVRRPGRAASRRPASRATCRERRTLFRIGQIQRAARRRSDTELRFLLPNWSQCGYSFAKRIPLMNPPDEPDQSAQAESLVAAGKRSTNSMVPSIYEELRSLATNKLAGESSGQTLSGTALVHEAYLVLAWKFSEPHSNPTSPLCEVPRSLAPCSAPTCLIART